MMEFEESNGLLLPKRRLPTILIFADETYLLDHSGLIQAAFPVPEDIYTELIAPRARDLLAALSKDAKEFKAGKIKKGNIGPYREFLDLFIGVSAHVADSAPLFPVVAVDGGDTLTDQQFERIQRNVEGAFANLGVEDDDAKLLIADFARQMLWLHRHLPTIAPRGFKNEVRFVFDARYFNATESLRERFFTGGALVGATLAKLETVLSSCARTLLSDHRSEMCLPNIGRVDRFRFVASRDESGLQAADMLSHLVYSGLRSAAGITNATTDFKTELLKTVMPEFDVDGELASRLEVGQTKDGRPEIRLTDRSLRSRFQLTPAENPS